jgi:hypothetical protein
MAYRLYRDRDGWKALSEIELDDERQLVIRTSKNTNGALATVLTVWKVEKGGSKTHVAGFGLRSGDYAKRIITSRPARITEKVVNEQHLLVLVQLESIKVKIREHYAPDAALPPAPDPVNPNPWVLVDEPATDDEDIVNDFPTFADAVLAQQTHGSGDIMKRLSSGVLTTEF